MSATKIDLEAEKKEILRRYSALLRSLSEKLAVAYWFTRKSTSK